MGELIVTVNGHNYPICCGDGEESHVRALAVEIDQRVRRLAETAGHAGNAHLFLLVSLLLLDEHAELRAKLRDVAAQTPHQDTSASELRSNVESTVATELADLIARIEAATQDLRAEPTIAAREG